MVLLHIITFFLLKSWHPDNLLNNFYRFSDFGLLIMEILVVFKSFLSDSFAISRGFSLAILYTLVSYSFLNLLIILCFQLKKMFAPPMSNFANFQEILYSQESESNVQSQIF